MPADAPSPRRGARWWPLLLVLAGAGARLFQIWFLRDYDRQFKVEQSWPVLRSGTGLGLAWLLLASRLPFRRRLAALAGLAFVAVTAVILVRVRGVTGDRLPVLEWRWAPRTDQLARRELAAGNPASPAVVAATNAAPALVTGPGFPQYLGPDRNGVLPGPRLAPDLRARPPRELWRQPVGAAWAGFAIAGSTAVTLEQNGGEEEIIARDLLTGARLWTDHYAARYDNASAGVGPRSVPTIAGDRVFAAGGTGVLTCADLRTGRRLWQVDLPRTFAATLPGWGFSSSPLVHGDVVITTPGGPQDRSVVALNAATGALVWGAGSNWAGYSSPVLATLNGVPQFLVFHAAGVAGHEAATGRPLWDFPVHNAPHVTPPVPAGTNRFVVSCGYGVGAFLVETKIEANGAWSANQVWKSIRLKSKFASLLVRDDSVYGLDDGLLACLDLATGALRWKETRYGHGQLLEVAGRLLVFTETGELAMVELSPQAPKELSRTRLFDGKTWNPPALSGDLLLVRTDREAACFRLATE